MKKIKKILKAKPSSHDIHYEYICPNCGFNHWLSSVEASTKNYKIVCDCKSIIIPKPIKNIEIIYKEGKIDFFSKENEENNSSNSQEQSPETSTESKKIKIDKKVLKQCTAILEQYGFEKKEASEMIKEIFDETKHQDVKILVKLAIQKIGVNADGQCV